MRVKLLFSALAAASIAHAQTVVADAPEGVVQNSYDVLRRNNDLTLEMYGTDTQFGLTSRTHAILYWRNAFDARTNLMSLAQVELDVSDVDAKGVESPRLRLVGDGVALHRYDVLRHEVTTTTYGFYGQKPPDNYANSPRTDAPKLLAQLRSATPGTVAYLIRLLDELNPTGPNWDDPNREVNGHPDRYADWLPGRANLSFDQVPTPIRQGTGASAIVRDPIVPSRTYVQGGDQWMFSGMDRTNTDRAVAFHMVQGDDGQYVVASVNVAQRTATRLIDLTLVPKAGAAPSWAYLPYTGAQAAAFRPVAARS